MSEMTKEHWRQWGEQWRHAAARLDRLRRAKLRTQPYDFAEADALLQIADQHGHSRPNSGLVELQRWLLKLAEHQGPGRSAVPSAPPAVAEHRPDYGKKRSGTAEAG